MARLQPDIVMECTGAPSVIRDCLGVTAPAGILCLAGVTAPGNKFDLDIGSLNRIMVRDNDVVFGTVNANRWHYKMAADALARADKAWLGRVITRRVPLVGARRSSIGTAISRSLSILCNRRKSE